MVGSRTRSMRSSVGPGLLKGTSAKETMPRYRSSPPSKNQTQMDRQEGCATSYACDLRVNWRRGGKPASQGGYMSARTTRREARERIIKSFMDSLDRIIPPEESVPLRGKTFLDWERQADAMRQAVLPTLLQERAALDEAAQVDDGQC